MATAITLVLDSTTVGNGVPSDFTTYFISGISGRGSIDIALEKAAMSYSFFNISQNLGNNILGYKTAAGNPTKQVVLPDGNYNVTDMNNYFQAQMKANGDYDQTNNTYYITISANVNALKTQVTISNNYVLDLTVSSIWQLLGYNGPLTISASGLSPNLINISNVNAILIHCSIVEGSYYNGNPSDILYMFVPNTSPGQYMTVQPNVPTYMRVLPDTIRDITMYVTDNLGNLLDFNNQPITYYLLLRERASS